MSLLNIMMDLKKCCNHPYLFPVAAMVGTVSGDRWCGCFSGRVCLGHGWSWVALASPGGHRRSQEDAC